MNGSVLERLQSRECLPQERLIRDLLSPISGGRSRYPKPMGRYPFWPGVVKQLSAGSLFRPGLLSIPLGFPCQEFFCGKGRKENG